MRRLLLCSLDGVRPDAIAQAATPTIDALKATGAWDDTVTLVLSDHGGHERSHGTDSPEDMTIPWLLHGPGVKEGVTLTEEVRLFDTPPTLAYLLSLIPDRYWEGRIATEALT
jgi:arylsulfatase A-like enzyme